MNCWYIILDIYLFKKDFILFENRFSTNLRQAAHLHPKLIINWNTFNELVYSLSGIGGLGLGLVEAMIKESTHFKKEQARERDTERDQSCFPLMEVVQLKNKQLFSPHIVR